jgi:hypothetical protein
LVAVSDSSKMRYLVYADCINLIKVRETNETRRGNINKIKFSKITLLLKSKN